MSAPLQRIPLVQNAVLPSQTTPEQRFWRAYRNPLIVKEHGSILHINFCPSGSHDFAVTSGARIQIFSSKTRQVIRTIARFKEIAYSGEFRPDGKLLVAGDASGLVQVFDANSRAILLTLNPTHLATHVTKFHPKSLTTLLSASDDRSVRLWDIASSEPTSVFSSHTDYVRTASFLSPASDAVVTGCYDGVVRIFDARAPDSPSLSLSHNAPVEAVLPLTSTTVLSAGGPSIKVWDLVAGKMVKDLGNFQKTVTSLSLGGSSTNASGDNTIIAGALDGHVKVFDRSSWEFKFGWKFGDAVLSTAVSPDQKHFVTGLSSGVLSIRTRKTEPRVKQGVKTSKKSATVARMQRGGEYKGEHEREILLDDKQNSSTSTNASRRRGGKTPLYEKRINAFRWGEALDAAFMPGTGPEVTVTVLEELKFRGKVRVSLSGRDEGQLEPILKWAVRTIDDFRNVSVVADWIAVIADMYAAVIEKSPVLEELVREFERRLKRQIELAKEAQKLEGMLEMLIQSH
ncbi:U3 small nucleolar RNA-associated protein [Myxozyma melibiosi]|uniref:U3 small nucleolar RNA-associated protein n=1 Tax=Myxozyma melibiosi TaxID=54550 RepID=A0ABR1F2B8_9ASCO